MSIKISDYTLLAKNVRLLRSVSGYSQAELAEASKISQSKISKIERDEAMKVNVSELERLSLTFNVPVKDLTEKPLYKA